MRLTNKLRTAFAAALLLSFCAVRPDAWGSTQDQVDKYSEPYHSHASGWDLHLGASIAAGHSLYLDVAALNAAIFDSSGNLQLPHYGAGVLTSDSSGNITASTAPTMTWVFTYGGQNNNVALPPLRGGSAPNFWMRPNTSYDTGIADFAA